MIHDKIIIGAGASGLMAAFSALSICSDEDEEGDVVLIEGLEVVGKKLTATGNGKCNFTNTYQSKECYRSSDPDKAFRIINRFDCNRTLELFKSIGVPHYERNGYCYPYGEQARTLRDLLVTKVESMGAVILKGKKVKSIERAENVYSVRCADGQIIRSKKLVVSTGGAAAGAFGTDGSFFKILSGMGLNIKKPLPALCGLKSSTKGIKKLDGVRVKCNCSLYFNRSLRPVYSERGEIIFNKGGISGIPVLNLSGFAVNEMESSGGGVYLLLDFFPDMEVKELKEYLCLVALGSVMEIGSLFCALINDKLFKVLLENTGLDYREKTVSYDLNTLRHEFSKLAGLMKAFRLDISGNAGFENAQTTSGGVSLKEINEKTMECYKYPGLYLTGEVLDVDGMCGGYNLQWAWTTGYIAGRS